MNRAFFIINCLVAVLIIICNIQWKAFLQAFNYLKLLFFRKIAYANLSFIYFPLFLYLVHVLCQLFLYHNSLDKTLIIKVVVSSKLHCFFLRLELKYLKELIINAKQSKMITFRINELLPPFKHIFFLIFGRVKHILN